MGETHGGSWQSRLPIPPTTLTAFAYVAIIILGVIILVGYAGEAEGQSRPECNRPANEQQCGESLEDYRKRIEERRRVIGNPQHPDNCGSKTCSERGISKQEYEKQKAQRGDPKPYDCGGKKCNWEEYNQYKRFQPGRVAPGAGTGEQGQRTGGHRDVCSAGYEKNANGNCVPKSPCASGYTLDYNRKCVSIIGGEPYKGSAGTGTGTGRTGTGTTGTAPRGGCLIATAAAGTEMINDVQHLRKIRAALYESGSSDLMQSINSAYYVFSPQVADLQRENPAFNKVVRAAITPAMAVFSAVDTESGDLGAAVLGAVLLNLGLYAGVPAAAVILARKSRMLARQPGRQGA